MSETKALSPIDTVRDLLTKLAPKLQSAMPRVGITADRLIGVAITSCTKTPKLLECDRKSLLSAIIQCGVVGLVPDGVLGDAYLIPYGGKVQFQIGYKGLAKLVRRSGEIETFLPNVVYQGDDFEYNLAEARVVKHVRTLHSDFGVVTHFYTFVRYKSGTIESMVMTAAEVGHVRDTFSKAYQYAVKDKKVDESIWSLHYEAMGCKTVMRKHAKYLPLSTEAQKAISLDEQAESGVSQDLAQTDALTDASESDAPSEPKYFKEPQKKAKDSGSGGDIEFGDPPEE